MVRMTGIKWEKSTQCRPIHNIISSDFQKYVSQPWKFMEGNSRIQWLLSNEYQRMWVEERDAWKKRMYPENTTVNVDVVKRYVLSFKNNIKPPIKPEVKKPFKMKQFEEIGSKTPKNRSPDGKVNKPKSPVAVPKSADKPRSS